MGLLKSESLAALFPGPVLLLVAGAAKAGVDNGDGVTPVQLAIGILVFLAYAVNHFRGRIKVLLKGLLPGAERRHGTDS